MDTPVLWTPYRPQSLCILLGVSDLSPFLGGFVCWSQCPLGSWDSRRRIPYQLESEVFLVLERQSRAGLTARLHRLSAPLSDHRTAARVLRYVRRHSADRGSQARNHAQGADSWSRPRLCSQRFGERGSISGVTNLIVQGAGRSSQATSEGGSCSPTIAQFRGAVMGLLCSSSSGTPYWRSTASSLPCSLAIS